MKIEFLQQLCEAPGIASNEEQVRAVLMKECQTAAGKISYDGLGSMIFTQEGQGPCVLLAAHMDEVGFLVRSVTPQGMLIVIPVGSVRTFSKFMQEVRVSASLGGIYYGILNAEYDADKKEIRSLYVDLGQDSREEIEKMGIRPGDMVTFSSGFREYENGRFAARALDDRAGCYVLGELMKQMSKAGHPNQLNYAFTSSEEVGTRGAKTAASVINPDLCIVLDVACHSTELVREHTNNRQLGKGPMLVHYDKTVVSHKKLVKLVRESADECGISLQDDMFLNGGTDGGALHLDGSGHPTVVLGIPTRYGHSPYSIGSIKDMEDIIKLLKCLLMKLDNNCYQLIRFEAETNDL